MPTVADMCATPIDETKLSGIDLNDPKIRTLVEEGFRDFTPERVLRYCEHIIADCEPSALGAALGLHSIGPKLLSCGKLRRSLRAESGLDEAFDVFKKGLGCEQCEHRTPRPEDWKFSIEWEMEEAKKHGTAGDPSPGA